MDAYQAGQQLGTLLFGGAPDAQGDRTPSLFDALLGRTAKGPVYYRTLLRGAQTQNAMQEARINRAKALIEEQRAAERAKGHATIAGVYKDPAQAALADMVLLGNENINLGNLGKYQNPNYLPAQTQAATDMNAGNFAGYDQQTALATGKPYEPVRVVDGTMLPSGVALGDAAFQAMPTPAETLKASRAGADKAANYQIVTGEDGKLYRVDKLTGAATPVTNATGTGLGGKVPPVTLTASDAKLLGDIDPITGKLTAKGQQDAAILAANPVKATLTKLFARTPLTNKKLPLDANGAPILPADIPLAPLSDGYAPTDASLGEAATASLPDKVSIVMAPGTDPRIVAATEAAARATPAIPARDELVQQAQAAIANGADKDKVQARLQKLFSQYGYK